MTREEAPTLRPSSVSTISTSTATTVPNPSVYDISEDTLPVEDQDLGDDEP